MGLQTRTIPPVIHLVLCLCILGSCVRQSSSDTVCTGPVCEFSLNIQHVRSMTYFTCGSTYNVEMNGTRIQVAANSLRPAESTSLVGQEVQPGDVITLDGRPATVISINGEFPGPTIEVMEGVEVSGNMIHVTKAVAHHTCMGVEHAIYGFI